LGNFSPRSSAAMSRVSSVASDTSDRNYWASRANQPSGIFGESPEKMANFKLAEMNFWNEDQKRSAWKTMRSGGGPSSTTRVRIPRGASSSNSSSLASNSPSNRPGSQVRSRGGSSVLSNAPLLSAWNSDSPMFL
jgi:hypothetical protein